ncbi:MAG: 30S ribosomal protein S6 [Candidatus Latescibacterota bacterium]|nr:MAG: 30S ribosomal protein S6 [Candidatus Latescibacterota bacterium]
MKKYECAVIFVPTVGNDVLESSTKKYAEVITSRGGNLEELDSWGKRTLAYEIDYHREGYYYFYRFEGSNDILGELNRQMRIDENVLRHMIVVDSAKARSLRKPVEEPTAEVVAAPVDVEGGEQS